MSSRIRIFLTGLLTLLTAALLALAPVAAKPTSNTVTSESTGFAQNFVGDIKGAEGSPIAAAGGEFATGYLHWQSGGNTKTTAETMQHYGNPIIAALTSGGDVNQFGVNRGIADSKLQHNYLNEAQRREVENLLENRKICVDGDQQCYREQDDISRQLRLLQDVSNAQTRAMIDTCSQGPSFECQKHIDASEGFVDWSLYSPYNEAYRYMGQTPSAFRAQTGVIDGVENQFDLDSIAREYMVAIQSGEMTPDEAGLAMAQDLQKQDGRLKIFGGAVEMAGAGACLLTKLTCILGLASAGIGADRAYEGTATVISGEDELSAIEELAEAAGVESPEALRDDIEMGVAIVTVGAGGGMLVYKGGKVVANLGKHADEVIPQATNGGDGVLAGDSYVPSGSAIIRGSTVRLDQSIITKNGEIIPPGSVITENGGAIKIVTPDGQQITGKTDNLIGSQQLALPPPATKRTLTQHADGTFSVSDWTGYPAGVPRPSEGTTYRLLSGSEYAEARRQANNANAQLRRQGVVPEGHEIHEIVPVKYGGSPTDPANKVYLPRGTHRSEVTPWWNRLQKDLER